MRAGAVLASAIVAAVLGSILVKLATGKYPWDYVDEDKKKLGLNELAALALEVAHPRVGGADAHGIPNRMTWPTDLRDVEHIILKPGGYLKGVLAEPWRNALDTIRNRDWKEDYIIAPHDALSKQIWQGLWYNLNNNYSPISVTQATGQPGQGPQTVGERAMRATGLLQGTPKEYDRSPAVNRTLEFEGPHTPLTPEEQQERAFAKEHPTDYQILRAARNKDRDYLTRVFSIPRGHDGYIPYRDAKEIYDVATPVERQELQPFMLRKQVEAVRAAR
jgi:hypothetical protein